MCEIMEHYMAIAREEGYQDGLELARQAVAMNIARNLINMDFDIDTIATATDLTSRQVTQLQEFDSCVRNYGAL